MKMLKCQLKSSQNVLQFCPLLPSSTNELPVADSILNTYNDVVIIISQFDSLRLQTH